MHGGAMKAKLLIAALVVGLAAGWLINGWRLNGEIKKIKAQHTQAALEFQMRARAKEQEWQIKAQEATDAAARREQTLRADADRARHAAVSLRDQLAEHQRRLPELTADAVRQYATALGDVFGECSERYTAVAEQADRLASDRQTLMDAWPK